MPPPPPPPYYAQPTAQQYAGVGRSSILHRWRAQGGILGGIATILLVLAKIGGPLLAVLKMFPILKILLTAGSMFVSMWLYAKAAGLGWAFGIGIVSLIFIHECGHAIAGKLRGRPTGIMVFIPFMGAFVTLKRGGKNIGEDAFIGIMGPVFGTLASLACLAIYFFHPVPFWLYLAAFGFWINLFNLAPTAPLDGGWIVPLFSPKLLAVGVVLLIILGFRNPLIWILGLLSLPRIIGGWKADTRNDPYYQATPAERWGIGLGYFGLALFLLFLFNVLGGFGTAYAMWGR